MLQDKFISYIFRITPSVPNGQSLQVDLDSWVLHVLSVYLVANGRHIFATIRLHRYMCSAYHDKESNLPGHFKH